MLVVRCANGVVLWRITYTDPRNHTLHCLTDGTSFSYLVGADSTEEGALVSVVQHSVSLKGAVLQIVQLAL